MARKKAVRRENGRGTVEKTNSKKNPFKAKVGIKRAKQNLRLILMFLLN